MVDLKELRAKAQAARAALAENVKTVELDIAGELVEVTFQQAPGDVWADLLVTHPPRRGTDANIGYNSDAASRDYPADLIRIGGETPDADTWHDIFDSLTSPSIKMAAAALWALNQNEPYQRILELGKAKAGASSRKRRSPAK